VPEARPESGPYNALYAYGQAHTFGFSPQPTIWRRLRRVINPNRE